MAAQLTWGCLMPNPYPQPFLKLFSELSPYTVIDIGSGNRSMPGVISMEYLEWSTNTVQGDVLSLPFRDDCADLILSQAVLEHVHYPDQAMQEMYRILRPGGVLYVEAAFMQPVHMAPRHYFNVTPYGLTWLLRDWDVIEQDTINTFQDVLDWLMKEAGVPRFNLKRLSRRISPKQYTKVAYGVRATARKPV